MPTVQARAIVKGVVQKVGYRDVVQETALAMGLTGYVKNNPDRTVEVVCEGDESLVDRFLAAIKVRKGFIEVKEVAIAAKSAATGEFKSFEIRRGDMTDELGERLDTAVIYLAATRDDLKAEIRTGLAGLGKKMDSGFQRVEASVKAHHKSTDKHFSNIIKRYDVFGESMRMLIGRMDKLESTLGRLVDAVIQNGFPPRSKVKRRRV